MNETSEKQKCFIHKSIKRGNKWVNDVQFTMVIFHLCKIAVICSGENISILILHRMDLKTVAELNVNLDFWMIFVRIPKDYIKINNIFVSKLESLESTA